jgi:hypothetical protein
MKGRAYAVEAFSLVVAGFPACPLGRGGRLESLLPPGSLANCAIDRKDTITWWSKQ